jgi:hypothetical protein
LTILINEQEVNFTLEGEEKAYEIYQGINSWLKESSHLIYSFSIDGLETDPENKENWQNKKASEINIIEVTALSEKEYLLTGLLTVAEYVNLLLRAVSGDKKEVLDDLVQEYSSIIKNIPVLVKGSQGILIADHLNTIMHNSGLLAGQFVEDFKETFLLEIRKISELITSSAREIEDPLKELKATFAVIEQLIPSINEVSILLQTGKDKEAMGLIISLTELLQKILRIISFFNTDNVIINGGGFESFSTELNSILNELAEAFDASDSVLIGDLLEYEITPKLELLPELINTIKLMEDE